MVLEEDTILHVGPQLPAVGWVGFLDVDHEKLHIILVACIQTFKGTHLGPKWWSGVTPKNQNNRPFTLELPKPDREFAVHRLELEIRRHISDMHRVDPTKIPLKPPLLVEKRRRGDFARSTASNEKRQRKYGKLAFHRNISTPLMQPPSKFFKPN
jgi:hypothetical protein